MAKEIKTVSDQVNDRRILELDRRLRQMEKKIQLMEKMMATAEKAIREQRVNILHLKRKDKPING